MRERPLEKLSSIAAQLGVPYGVHEYRGEEPEFCVYQVDSVDPVNFADDRALDRIAHVRFSYIQPIDKSFDAVMWKIIDAMTDAGFTEPLVVVDMQTNTKRTVLTFSAEISI